MVTAVTFNHFQKKSAEPSEEGDVAPSSSSVGYS